MLQRLARWIDFMLFVVLVGFGIGVLWARPWGLDSAASASLTGALFGGAAVLLGNWINRANEQHKAADALDRHRIKLKTLIAAEAVDVAIGLHSAKHLMDVGIATLMAGSAGLGQIDMGQHVPRGMPLTEGLGSELLILDSATVDALTTLRSNLALTRQAMGRYAVTVKTTHGLTLLTATELSNALGHDMTVLAEVFGHIAPNRKMAFPGDKEPKLVMELLKIGAQPPREPAH